MRNQEVKDDHPLRLFMSPALSSTRQGGDCSGYSQLVYSKGKIAFLFPPILFSASLSLSLLTAVEFTDNTKRWSTNMCLMQNT